MVRKTTLLIIAATLTAVAANAQLLWKVTAPSSDKVSYLLGTHHLAPDNLLDSIAGFNQAFHDVEAIYGEMDMAAVRTPEGAMTMQQALLAPTDSTLTKVFSPEEIADIEKLIKTYISPDMTLSALDMLKPVGVTTMLTVAMTLKECGLTEGKAIDEVVQTMGRDAGKRIGGLETLERQIDLLFNTPVSTQAEGLLKIARNTGLYAESARSLYNAYRRGNLKGIMAEMSAPVTGMNDEEAEQLLFARNRAWAEFLVGALPVASMMVVVGGGHLGGDEGLISLLRAKGFTVEPVEPEPQLN